VEGQGSVKELNNILVLGDAEGFGFTAARVLLDHGFEAITLGDSDGERARVVAESFDRTGVQGVPIDLRRLESLGIRLVDFDLVLSSLKGRPGQKVINAALDSGTHYVDLGGALYPTRLTQTGERAQSAGSMMVFGCGAAPGLTNVLAAQGARDLQEIWSIQIAIASHKPIVLSKDNLQVLLDQFSPDCDRRWIHEDANLVEVPPFSRKRVVTFLPPVGAQRVCVIPHEEVISLPRSIRGVEEVVVYGSLRPSQMQFMRNLHDLGLLSKDPLEVEGATISPLEFLKAHFEAHPPAEAPFGCHKYLWIEVQGLGEKGTVCRRFRTRHPDWGSSQSDGPELSPVGSPGGDSTIAMNAIPAALTVCALRAKGEIDPGAYSLDEVLTLEDLLPGLTQMEIEIQETETGVP